MTKLTKRSNITAGQLFIIGLLSLFIISCDEEEAKMEGNVLPPSENLAGYISENAHPLITTNQLQGTVITSDATYGIIGNYNDPKFGNTNAGFVSNFSLGGPVKFEVKKYINSNNDTIDTKTYYKMDNGDGWSLDSVVISVPYYFNNWVGNMEAEQEIAIYKLNAPLADNSTNILHNSNISTDTEPIVSKKVYPNMDISSKYRSTENWKNVKKLKESYKNLFDSNNDTIYLHYNKENSGSPSWRFNISKDKEFAKEIFKLDFNEDLPNNQKVLKNFLNGLYFKVSNPVDAFISRVYLLSSDDIKGVTITTYFKYTYKINEDATDEEGNPIKKAVDSSQTFTYDFVINRENTRFNVYNHELSSNIKFGDRSSENLYIHEMSGSNSYVQLQFPQNILSWSDSLRTDGDNAIKISNIKFYLNIDTLQYDDFTNLKFAGFKQPDSLKIGTLESGKIIDAIKNVNGTKYKKIIGSTTNSKNGKGEYDPYEVNKKDYRYYFILNTEYFEEVMKLIQAEVATYDDLTEARKEELIKDYFTFDVGIASIAPGFNRVILKGNQNSSVIFKYFHYKPQE